MLVLVGVLLWYSKRPDIADDLERTLRKLTHALSEAQGDGSKSVRNDHHRSRVWVRDRLTEEDVERLIVRYREGATQRELVKEFKIGCTSLKRLLRERGIQRKGK